MPPVPRAPLLSWHCGLGRASELAHSPLLTNSYQHRNLILLLLLTKGQLINSLISFSETLCRTIRLISTQAGNDGGNESIDRTMGKHEASCNLTDAPGLNRVVDSLWMKGGVGMQACSGRRSKMHVAVE